MTKPILAITMGDPTGVGPEIIAGCWADPRFHELCRAVVVGHPEVMRRAVALKQRAIDVREIQNVDDAPPSPALMPCIQATRDDCVEAPAATIDARGGQAAYDALMWATDAALAGTVDGLVTAPLHKTALWAAGHHYPGHTELLAERCGVDDFAMMLYLSAEALRPASPDASSPSGRGLGVIHVTLHMALRDVFNHLTTDAIMSKARLAADIMRRLNGVEPRIALAALNPHAGESGLFGDEEARIIAPAAERLRAEGLDVHGPLSTDTLMPQARDGAFDAVVAMYHDQGHIALKLLAMHQAVNVTLGLPIVRTSVAHGTAFDLAWKGVAETAGMIEAVRVAARLCATRTPSHDAAATKAV